MNKRVKMGPVLVVGALVLLVGMAMMLSSSPAPQPAADRHDHEGEEAAKEESKDKKAEKPKLDLDKIKAQLDSGNPQAAAEAIGELQGGYFSASALEKPKIAALLQELAIKNDQEGVRVAATGALGPIGEVAPEVLIAIAKSDRSPDVVKAALMAMAGRPNDPQVEATLRSFTGSSDPGIRSAAALGLTTNLALAQKAGAAQLCALLGQYDNDMSAQAAMKLEQAGPRVLADVTKVLYTNPSGPTRQGAAMVIALSCAGWNASLENFAKSAQVTHRQVAGDLQSNQAGLQPLLWALQNDPWAPTREIAAQGLGYLGDVRAAKPLAAALKDPDALVRRRAAAALITVPAATVVSELSAAATTDKNADVRRFAVEALGWVAQPEAIPALVQATKDTSATVRRYAATELGKLADPQAVDALSAMLSGKGDPDDDVRWAAVVALGKLQDKRAADVLIKCLSDVSPQVQNSAERALQRLGVARREEAGFKG